MKVIRIFLLVLIIIGLAALATEKLWVPKLVQHIISKEGVPVPVAPTPQANIVLENGRQCYTYSHGATPEAPYAVNEFIDMTITDGAVNGLKAGTQSGPDMTNGYGGTIVGTSSKDGMNVVFSYTVEGSQNKEKEIYRTGLTGIEKLRYPLVQSGDMLVPDTTKDFQVLRYARVGCTPSN